MAGDSDVQDKAKSRPSVKPNGIDGKPIAPGALNSESIEVVVVVKAREIAHTDKVAERLAGEGMVVDGIMAGYGAVVGQAESDRVDDLAKVKGVLRVETDQDDGNVVHSPRDRSLAEAMGSAKIRQG